jgi:hypothetical protein
MFQVFQCDEAFKIFPYDADLKNGRTNNGGFDLVGEPEKISEIKELDDKPWLRKIILHLNRTDGPLKSYGCDFVQEESSAWGYVDFAIRDHSIAKWWMEYDSILTKVGERFTPQYPDRIRMLKAKVQEEVAGEVLAPIWKVSIEYRVPNQDEANKMLSAFFCMFEGELIPQQKFPA